MRAVRKVSSQVTELVILAVAGFFLDSPGTLSLLLTSPHLSPEQDGVGRGDNLPIITNVLPRGNFPMATKVMCAGAGPGRGHLAQGTREQSLASPCPYFLTSLPRERGEGGERD